MRQLRFRLTFRDDKPARDLRLSTSGLFDGNNYSVFENPEMQIKENEVLWTVDSPQLGSAYRIDWSW
jgi:hypothetical protein